MSNWISVKESLPTQTGNVIGYWSGANYIDMALYVKHDNSGGRWGLAVGNITHWMPKPKGPELIKP